MVSTAQSAQIINFIILLLINVRIVQKEKNITQQLCHVNVRNLILSRHSRVVFHVIGLTIFLLAKKHAYLAKIIIFLINRLEIAIHALLINLFSKR